MFSLRKRTVNRIKKRAEHAIVRFERRNQRPPLMRDITKLQLFSAWERIAFTVIGSLFLYTSLMLVRENVYWVIPNISMSGYVTYRGIMGHALKVGLESDRQLAPELTATSELLLNSIDARLTTLSRTLLILDISFLTLLIIFEIVISILGAVASAFS